MYSVNQGRSADREGDLKRADELVSRALALDPTYARALAFKAGMLRGQGRLDESVAENERALALDPTLATAYQSLAWNYVYLGQFEKARDFVDKAIRLSPQDPLLASWYSLKAADHFSLKQYDQAIESARRSIAINPNRDPWPHLTLIAALISTGHEVEAHEPISRASTALSSSRATRP